MALPARERRSSGSPTSAPERQRLGAEQRAHGRAEARIEQQAAARAIEVSEQTQGPHRPAAGLDRRDHVGAAPAREQVRQGRVHEPSLRREQPRGGGAEPPSARRRLPGAPAPGPPRAPRSPRTDARRCRSHRTPRSAPRRRPRAAGRRGPAPPRARPTRSGGGGRSRAPARRSARAPDRRRARDRPAVDRLRGWQRSSRRDPMRTRKEPPEGGSDEETAATYSPRDASPKYHRR